MGTQPGLRPLTRNPRYVTIRCAIVSLLPPRPGQPAALGKRIDAPVRRQPLTVRLAVEGDRLVRGRSSKFQLEAHARQDVAELSLNETA